MEESCYRILFRKLNSDQTKPFTEYLIHHLEFEKERAGHLLKNSPAILYQSHNKGRVKGILSDLKGLGAQVSVLTVVKNEKLPFFIDRLQFKWAAKILNMSLRAGVDSILVYVDVQPEKRDGFMVPLTGREDEIEKSFRESDTIYIIDDNRLLFIGFSTDNSGLHWLIPKIAKIVKTIVGPKAEINIGTVLFPDDGYSFSGLMYQAVKRLSIHTEAETKAKETVTRQEHGKREEPSNRNGITRPDLSKICFIMARGVFFHTLLMMDPDRLWASLKRLSIQEQNLFLLRLPYNAPMVEFLSKNIENQSPVKDPADPAPGIKKLLIKLKFEKKIIERKKNHTQMIARLNRLETLSTLPSIALQIYNMALNPSSEIEEIQKLIRLDQVLTLKILKLVNSAYYGLAQRVDSVKEAVLVLGMDEIINMAFGLSLSKAFKISDLDGWINPDKMWKHTVATAVIGKYLARNLEDSVRSASFTACILHDVGKLFMIENFPDHYIRIMKISKKTGIPVYDLEEELFGKNHGEIGGMIAEKWNLPRSLSDAIAFHHHPSLSADHAGLSAIVGFADYLSNRSLENDLEGRKTGAHTLLKDHVNILQGMFEQFNAGTVDETLEDTKCYLEKNNEIFSVFS